MIEHTIQLAHNCVIIVTDQSNFITCELRTDGERLYIIKNKMLILDKQTFETLMKSSSNNYALICNKIIKITDNCFMIPLENITTINIKFQKYMNEWNTRFAYLIEQIPVYNEDEQEE